MKKRVTKKLSLTKMTVSNLEDVKGGAWWTLPCWTEDLRQCETFADTYCGDNCIYTED